MAAKASKGRSARFWLWSQLRQVACLSPPIKTASEQLSKGTIDNRNTAVEFSDRSESQNTFSSR